MPMDETAARRAQGAALQTDRVQEMYQISPERCFAVDANLSPAPAFRPPAGGEAARACDRLPSFGKKDSTGARPRASAKIRQDPGDRGPA